MPKQITHIVVHCSDSTWGDKAVIDSWHRARGWAGCGYHYVILNGKRASGGRYVAQEAGLIEKGRSLDNDDFISGSEVGAHTLGLNDCSIGICLIGKDSFRKAQLAALQFLILDLMDHHRGITIDNVVGHCETASGKAENKTCPNFSMAKVRNMLRAQQSIANITGTKDFNFV